MMNNPLDPLLLARIEYAGLTASAPREQRWVDGWLVRTSPAKAKRARCVNAVAAGHGDLHARIRACERLYEAAGLPAIFRITPFSQPAGLDGILAGMGMVRFDDTRVMVLPMLDAMAVGTEADSPSENLQLRLIDTEGFAERVGGFRGSPAALRRAQAERLALSAVPMRPYELLIGEEPVACALVVLDDDLAGLYDVHTAAPHRGRGLAGYLCRRVLGLAATEGARRAYLQVEVDNLPALAVYQRIGFGEGYRYHYRCHRSTEPA